MNHPPTGLKCNVLTIKSLCVTRKNLRYHQKKLLLGAAGLLKRENQQVITVKGSCWGKSLAEVNNLMGEGLLG